MLTKTITICACSSRSFIDKDKVVRLAAVLTHAGMAVVIVPDLCKQAIQDTSGMASIASSAILACYPRAVSALFASIGLEPGQVLDIRTGDTDAILAQLGATASAVGAVVEGESDFREMVAAFPVEAGTDAWYPVIDKDRCSECEKCHDFCLFGVYTLEDGRVTVKQPQQCKNNCPACARVCPSKAVIFPKYEKSPINGGEADEEQAMLLDTKTLYAEALRTRLEHRRASVSLLRRDQS